MYSNNSSPSDTDSPTFQTGNDETIRADNTRATIDDVLSNQETGTGSYQGNNPKQYDIPHPIAREWMAKRHSSRWSDETVCSYQSNVRTYLSYLEETGTTLLDATFVDLVEYVEYRIEVGAARSTVSGDCSALKDLYRYIEVRTDAKPEIEPYVFNELDLSAYDYDGGFERRDIDPHEVSLLFESFKHARNRLMAYFAVATGVRNSDIRTLRQTDVDYEKLEIHIPDPKNGDPYDVPMSRELASKLKQWERTSREGYSTAESSPYMFPAERGEKLEDNSSFNTIIVRAAERAGIQKKITTQVALDSRNLRNERYRNIHRVTAHTLRHTCLTMLKKAGAPPEARRKMANHKDIETTEHYTHDDDEDKDWRELIRDLLDF